MSLDAETIKKAVKPLEWVQSDNGSDFIHCRAQTMIGIYEAWHDRIAIRDGIKDIIGWSRNSSRDFECSSLDNAKAFAQADYEARVISALSPEFLSALDPQSSRTEEPVICPCTLIEQDEDCTIGYPSLLCSECGGKGVTTPDKVAALAAEMLNIANQVGDPEDPFAAWETISLLQSQDCPRKAMESALRIVEAETQRVEASPESEWGGDYYGDPSVPGGTFSWSKKDEELHYLRRDAEELRKALSTPNPGDGA